MIIRLRRLTPGYFRLLQMQITGELEPKETDRLVNHVAMLLAMMGLSLSYYSMRKMTKKEGVNKETQAFINERGPTNA
ncbi:putative transmembrane protein ZNF593OS [Latimeria chalumnae]|uniref:putative transmembrane protein ZNF593OS n=1 Tax=Latimeria chalumnae TaxID=7897 RepID=UPI00313D8791